MRAVTTALLALAACAGAGFEATNMAPVWQEVYHGTFAAENDLTPLHTSDPNRWRRNDDGGVPSLELLGKCAYEPAVRSPHSIALLPDVDVGDFDLELDLLQTGKEYAHRDMCLIFGFQDPQHFYYVHLATTPDPNAHNVFVVDGAPRKNLLPPPPAGVDWGQDQWHHVRIERRVEAGTIRVFWDDQQQPILETESSRFDHGRIGLGSFDDSGRFANVVVRAPQVVRLPGVGNPFSR
ncbi:MAG: hypothetical protein H6835_19160 [Planctomycetes bacterium]|nr:hypothetical protein [Planctomycetota bacterium]